MEITLEKSKSHCLEGSGQREEFFKVSKPMGFPPYLSV